MNRFIRTGFILLTAALAGLPGLSVQAQTPTKMYWIDGGLRKIQRANTDGSELESVVDGLSSPFDIALDTTAGKLYWTDRSGERILSANLDGSDVTTVISGLNSPQAIALDPVNARLYWGDVGARKIQRANLNGSGKEDLVAGVTRPQYMTLDLAGGKFYWTDHHVRKIQRANLDGSNVEALLSWGTNSGRNPDGIKLDVANGKMYWADSGSDRIYRADLDGSNEEIVIAEGVEPRGIALDLVAGKIYWVDGALNRVYRANLSGGAVETLVNAGLDLPKGIALDLAAGKMYWTSQDGRKIQRANLDGSSVDDLVTPEEMNTAGVLDRPNGLALDVAAQKVYWTDAGADKIQRANLNGAGVEDLVVSGLTSPAGIALDSRNGKMYWADEGTGKIQRANLDGSTVDDLVTGLTAPFGVAIAADSGMVYWTDHLASTIQRVRLDGTGIQTILTSAQGLSTPHNIAVDGVNGRLYWTDASTGKIRRAGLDGSNPENLVSLDARGIGLDVPNDRMYWVDAVNQLILRSSLSGGDTDTLISFGIDSPVTLILDAPGNGGISGVSGRLQIDGKIAFTSDRNGDNDVYTMDTDGSNVTQLTNTTSINFGPVWSPDGSKITFTSDRDGNHEIYVMNADGSNQTRLTNDAASDQISRWSPDGSKIVFTSDRDAAERDIYVMNANGSNVRRLTTDPARDAYPSYAPDGSKIVFTSTRDNAQIFSPELYTMDADGENEARLTNNTREDADPFFSPDGTKIVFSSLASQDVPSVPSEVYSMNADGANETRLTSNSVTESSVFWSPDGTGIVFYSNRDGNGEIYSMNADGSNPTRLTSNNVNDKEPSWTPFQRIGAAVLGSPPVSRTMIIRNTGNDTLTVTDITLNGSRFSASPTAFSLASGDSQNVSVAFTPTGVGTVYDTLEIASNDPVSAVIKLIINGTGLPPPVLLSLPTVFAAPGDTASLLLTMAAGDSRVGGLQVDALPDSFLTVVGLVDSTGAFGFSGQANTFGDTTRLLFTASGGGVLPAGTTTLGLLRVFIHPNAPLSSTHALPLANAEIGDSLGVALPDSLIDGAIQVGIRGDVNLDARISILDIIKLVRIIVDNTLPDSGSVAFNIADMNADAAINITDVVRQVNVILHLPLTRPEPVGPVAVTLGEVVMLDDGVIAIPVILNLMPFGGLQATFSFDPGALTIGTPRLAGDHTSLLIDSRQSDGRLIVAVVNLTAADISGGALLFIPVTLAGPEAAITLTSITLVNRQASVIPVQLSDISRTVISKEAALPTAFALHAARPNPFNPSTQIAYDVPYQGHVTLVVYNLLGQEVVRLVDEIKTPGRYTATWNGRNARGLAVASGVYVYRMVAGGFSKAKRMTLVK